MGEKYMGIKILKKVFDNEDLFHIVAKQNLI